MTPPDRLVSGSFVWMGSHCRQFQKMMKQIPDDMVRAKGVFKTGTGTYLFNWVMGHGQFEKITTRQNMTPLMNRIVFIGPPEAMAKMGKTDFGGTLQRGLAK